MSGTGEEAVVVGCGGGALKVYDARGRETGSMTGHQHLVEAVVACGMQQQGAVVASSSRDNDVILWNVSSGQR